MKYTLFFLLLLVIFAIAENVQQSSENVFDKKDKNIHNKSILVTNKEPYQIIKQSGIAKHDDGYECAFSYSYPAVPDEKLIEEFKKEAPGCHSDGGGDVEISFDVEATVYNDLYVVLDYSKYWYAEGTPHGYSYGHIEIYKKNAKGRLEKIEIIGHLIKNSQECEALIEKHLFKVLNASTTLWEWTTQHSLLQDASINLKPEGFEFSYAPYIIATYANTPSPILITFEELKDCHFVKL